MFNITFRISLTLLFTILVISVLTGQRDGNLSDHPKGPNMQTEGHDGCNQYLDDIVLWRECMCNKRIIFYCQKSIVNQINLSNSSNNKVLPTVSFTHGKLSIDSKVNAVEHIKVHIFDLFTSELKEKLVLDNLGQSGATINFNDVYLTDGFYLVVMNIDGFISKEKLVVISR